MKNKFVLFFGMLVAVMTSGCISWNNHNGTTYSRPVRGQEWNLAPMGQTEVDEIFPQGPRRRSVHVQSWDGSYRYDHDQGTDTRVDKSWDPYYGPRIDMERRTWNRTHESYDPERRRYYQHYR